MSPDWHQSADSLVQVSISITAGPLTNPSCLQRVRERDAAFGDAETDEDQAAQPPSKLQRHDTHRCFAMGQDWQAAGPGAPPLQHVDFSDGCHTWHAIDDQQRVRCSSLHSRMLR